MVVPLAVVSTSCDELLDELNELSAPKELHPRPYASHLLQSQRDAMTHADYYKIESLLNYLKGLNNRQGRMISIHEPWLRPLTICLSQAWGL